MVEKGLLEKKYYDNWLRLVIASCRIHFVDQLYPNFRILRPPQVDYLVCDSFGEGATVTQSEQFHQNIPLFSWLIKELCDLSGRARAARAEIREYPRGVQYRSARARAGVQQSVLNIRTGDST